MPRHGRRVERRHVLVAGGVVAALVASIGLARLTLASDGTADCADPVRLTVGTDPTAVSWLRDLASSYTVEQHVVADRCVTVAVNELSLTNAQRVLQPVPVAGAGLPPDVWLPDSSTALALVRSQPQNAGVLPAAGPPIASSPVVVAGPNDALRVLRKKLPTNRTPSFGDFLLLGYDQAGWGAAGLDRPEWGKLRFSIADPSTNAIGTSVLTAAAGAGAVVPISRITPDTPTDLSGVRGEVAFVRSLSKVQPTVGALLRGVSYVRNTPDLLSTFGLVFAYEQDIWKYNRNQPALPLSTAYPTGGGVAADFPYIVPNASWVDSTDRLAADDFRRWLQSSSTQRLLGLYGLRRADGRAGPELGVEPAASRQVPDPLRSADTAAQVRSLWQLLNTRGSVLGVLDTSAAMGKRVTGTRFTKLDLARQAAETILPVFDPKDRLGLWEFATRLDGAQDHRELIPLGPATGQVNGTDRVTASYAAYEAMRPRNGTGLYDTVVAAYQEATRAYQPGYLNVIILLTGGRNDDPGGRDLNSTLAELNRLHDPKRPVYLITVAYGKDADRQALTRLARITGGLAYDAPDERDTARVFLTGLEALAN